jgi:hypothetical protein
VPDPSPHRTRASRFHQNARQGILAGTIDHTVHGINARLEGGRYVRHCIALVGRVPTTICAAEASYNQRLQAVVVLRRFNENLFRC